VTPFGPPPQTYAGRRAKLLERLTGAALFIPAVPEAVYANDVHYRYRPDTNARYLTGFEEPAGVLLSGCAADGAGYTLFVLPSDPEAETWTGRRVGIEGARERYGADHAYAQSQTFEVLAKHLEHATVLFYAYSRDASVNQRVLDVVQKVNAARPKTGAPLLALQDADALLSEMRLFKSPEEVGLLRTACTISGESHRRLMETLRPGMFEYQAEAVLDHGFRSAGCAGPAYGTIAAGGVNATVLHYTRNDTILKERELILVDAGGEYGGYCADITRTFPVGTSYTPSQAGLYDLVVEAQRRAIEAVAPGATYESVHKAAVTALVEGLLDLGILHGDVASCVESEAYKPFFMHRTSHWLGMDVHDIGSYRDASGSRVLKPGMVLTVEPGLYIRTDAAAPEPYRGIGIRIEDDVAVTAEGREVLSSAAPKQRDEIEKLRRKALGG